MKLKLGEGGEAGSWAFPLFVFSSYIYLTFFLSLKSFIGLGSGAGTNVLMRYAVFFSKF